MFLLGRMEASGAATAVVSALGKMRKNEEIVYNTDFLLLGYMVIEAISPVIYPVQKFVCCCYHFILRKLFPCG